MGWSGAVDCGDAVTLDYGYVSVTKYCVKSVL